MTREEAINVLDKAFYLSERAQEAANVAIEALRVDLVRCKDCKHGKVETEPRRPWEGDITCKLDGTDREWYKDDYCSYGERRSDE